MKQYWIQEDTAKEMSGGEWVRWDDAQDEIDKLKAELTALKEPLSLDIPDGDKMFEQIDQWARQSIAHWRWQIRGQQITRCDSGDYHIIMATLRWVKEHITQPQNVLSAEEVVDDGFYWYRPSENDSCFICEYDSQNKMFYVDGNDMFIDCHPFGQFIGPIKTPEG